MVNENRDKIIEERMVEIAEYIKQHKCTVREAAKEFGISKSAVHNDVSIRLKKTHPLLAKEVQEILNNNYNEKHIRGGVKTKHVYETRRKLKGKE